MSSLPKTLQVPFVHFLVEALAEGGGLQAADYRAFNHVLLPLHEYVELFAGVDAIIELSLIQNIVVTLPEEVNPDTHRRKLTLDPFQIGKFHRRLPVLRLRRQPRFLHNQHRQLGILIGQYLVLLCKQLAIHLADAEEHLGCVLLAAQVQNGPLTLVLVCFEPGLHDVGRDDAQRVGQVGMADGDGFEHVEQILHRHPKSLLRSQPRRLLNLLLRMLGPQVTVVAPVARPLIASLVLAPGVAHQNNNIRPPIRQSHRPRIQNRVAVVPLNTLALNRSPLQRSLIHFNLVFVGHWRRVGSHDPPLLIRLIYQFPQLIDPFLLVVGPVDVLFVVFDSVRD